MWMSISVTIVAGVIFWLEGTQLRKQKKRKEQAILLCLLFPTVMLSILVGMKKSFSLPFDWIMIVCKPITQLLF